MCPLNRNSCLHLDIEVQHIEGPRVRRKKCVLFGAPEPVPGDFHAHCWKKVWLSEVPCQHRTSRQHVPVCLVGLETASKSARDALFYHNGKQFSDHNGNVPEIVLLKNIILSPTDVSQELSYSGAVFASLCSCLLLVSMFPLGSK